MTSCALVMALSAIAVEAQTVRPPSIEGYATALSVAAGETVGLAVSTDAPGFDVEVFRVGKELVSVWKRDGVAGAAYPIPRDVSSRGCRWPVALTIPTAESWKSGYYVARLKPVGTPPKALISPTSEAYFVVRSAHPGRDTKILLQLATNTYNAYNNYGGYSLYGFHAKDKVQGRRVSFDRPGGSQFASWERPFVAWAETHGYTLDYAANSDLELRPGLVDAYKLVLSVGHDEYWSAPMRDTLEAFIGRGGNAAFFSGNSVCWQVRTEDDGRALACWKQDFGDDPVYISDDRRRLTTLWSHHLVNRPENQLTGVGFLWGGYHKSHGQFMDGSGAFTTHRPEHWAFRGTQLARGQAFGGKDTVVGYECDGCELSWKGGVPSPTHRDGTPSTFVVLATCPTRWHPDDSEWYEKWEKGRTGNAVMGAYTRGGTVFTVGSTDWSHGLRGGDPDVETITRNVLDRLTR